MTSTFEQWAAATTRRPTEVDVCRVAKPVPWAPYPVGPFRACWGTAAVFGGPLDTRPRPITGTIVFHDGWRERHLVAEMLAEEGVSQVCPINGVVDPRGRDPNDAALLTVPVPWSGQPPRPKWPGAVFACPSLTVLDVWFGPYYQRLAEWNYRVYAYTVRHHDRLVAPSGLECLAQLGTARLRWSMRTDHYAQAGARRRPTYTEITHKAGRRTVRSRAEPVEKRWLYAN